MIVIDGQPIPKKNGMVITSNGIMQKKGYRDYEKAALWQLKAVREMYTGPVWVKCLYWRKDRRSVPDLLNLLAGTHDLLEKSGVIDNDRNVVSVDGSRYMGVDASRPRVEIWIEKMG